MGADKALLLLGGESAVERVVRICRAGGVAGVTVVRSRGAAPLPDGLAAESVLSEGSDMVESVRAGVRALPPECRAVLVFPVDHAMVAEATVSALLAALHRGAAVALPVSEGRPGHPIGLSRAVACEVNGDIVTLRDVVGRDPVRIVAVPVTDAWIHRDLDTPEDLAAARAEIG
ncbi:MAG: NTP transferase domain-containing protein [Planctomycetes bacterium]|nr:NTP transferase domain-containing protein [Planctomycetota bacterium]MCB9888200.1 NTP transferase domain-containing protein [Planctomycetota bacterium]